MTSRRTSPALQAAIDQHRQIERYLFRFARDRRGGFSATGVLKLPVGVLTHPRAVDDWSIKDVLALLIVWEEALLAWYSAGRRGRASVLPRGGDPTVPDPGRFAKLRRRSVSQTLLDFQRSHRKVVETLQRGGEAGALGEIVASTLAARYTWTKAHVRRLARRQAAGTLNKRQLIETIRWEHKRLERMVAKLARGHLTKPGVAGEWSVKDILAHLSDWEQRFLGWYEAGRRGEVPHTPAPGLTWNDLPELNRRIFERYRRWSLDRVMKRFQESYRQVLTTVRTMSEDDLFTPGRYAWTRKGTLSGYAAASTFEHYRWAIKKIDAWRG